MKKSLLSRIFCTDNARTSAKIKKHTALRLEQLEDRRLLSATEWWVNTAADPSSWDPADEYVSLREAIDRAADGDIIKFDANIDWTADENRIELSNGQLTINKSLTIDASGIYNSVQQAQGVTIDANQLSRVFYLSNDGGGCCDDFSVCCPDYCDDNIITVSMIGLTVTGGTTTGFGGGIYNDEAALTLTNCVISENISTGKCNSYGGGIYNDDGTLTMTNCAVTDNSASQGGGIYNDDGAVTLTNCTVSGNIASQGGGIYNDNAAMTSYNSIIALNTSACNGNDIYNTTDAYGSFYRNHQSYTAYNTLSSYTAWTAGADNLTYDSSLPLFNEDGYTLIDGSQAVNAGNNDFAVDAAGIPLEYDLAGNARIVNQTVDIGAYEYDFALLSVSLSTTAPYVGTEIFTTLNPAAVTASYQWYRLSPTESNAVAIDGATSESYVVTADDIGCYLIVIANGIEGYYGTVNAATTSVVPVPALTILPVDLDAADGYEDGMVYVRDVVEGTEVADYTYTGTKDVYLKDGADSPFTLNSETGEITTNTSLAVGSYTFKVTDGTLESDEITIVVSANPVLAVTPVELDGEDDDAEYVYPDEVLGGTIVAGYTYTGSRDVSLSEDSSFALAVDDDGNTIITTSEALTAGTYTVWLTDGTLKSDAITIVVVSLSAEQVDLDAADGYEDGMVYERDVVEGTKVADYTYTGTKDVYLNDGADSPFTLNSETGEITTNTSLAVGSYTFKVTDGTLESDEITIVVSANPVLTVTPIDLDEDGLVGSSDENGELVIPSAVVAGKIVAGYAYMGTRTILLSDNSSFELMDIDGTQVITTSKDLAVGTYQVRLTDGTQTSDTITIIVESPRKVWDISAQDGSRFTLDSDGTIVTLSNENGDVIYTALLSLTEEVVINGNAQKQESLSITASAMLLLDEIMFNGGTKAIDSISIEGSIFDDTFLIDTEEVVTEETAVAANPYEKLLVYYRKLYGEDSLIYQKLKKSYDGAFERMNKCSRKSETVYGVVEMEYGAVVKFIGVTNADIDAKEGNDTFSVTSLGYAYNLTGGDDVDTLNFSNASRVQIDMGSERNQSVLSGDSGSVRLIDSIESVVGTAGSDRITGDSNGTIINGNGGSDSVVLIGGENQVTLTGNRQSVTVRGNGTYSLWITGDDAVVNAKSAGNDATVNLLVFGNRLAFMGGQTTVFAAVFGDDASLDCSSTQSAALQITGDDASVRLGRGDDTVTVLGDSFEINDADGDDLFYCFGSNGKVNAGRGNDAVYLYAEQGATSSNNRIYGGDGDDFIYAADAGGGNYFNAGSGNDIIVGGAGNDTIEGTSGINILIGLGGADRIYGGGRGRNLLIASRTSNMADMELQTEEARQTFFDDLYAAWTVDGDMEATIELLGAASIADGSQDRLRRGGKENLLYANSQADNDWENAVEGRPYFDTLIDS